MWSSHRGKPTIGEDRRIRLLRKLSEDPIGTVWDAEDGPFRRRVTVRTIRDDLGAHGRFMRVLRAGLPRVWPRLQHPNVARAITYIARPDPTLHIVMQRLQGETLADRLNRTGRIDPTEAHRIGSEVRAALDAAHALGLVHGGLTPHSVFLTETDGAKVIDFGIPVALWTTAREAGEAVGDDDVALRLDRERDARDLERLMQRMLTGDPASGEFDLRRLIELVLASPSEPPVTTEQSTKRSSSRRRPMGRRSARVGRAKRVRRSAAGAWVGRARDSFIDAAQAVWSTPRRAARSIRRSCRRAWDSVADGLRGVASGPRRGVRAATRPLRGTGRGLRTLVVGTGRGLRTLVVGTGRGLRTLTHPIQPAGRHVAGATRAVAAAPRRAAPATGRLLRQAMYPLVGAGVIVVAVLVGVGILEGVPTSGVREQPAAASVARSTAPSPPPVTDGVTVPDVSGLSPMEAGALLTGMGLSVVDAEPAPGPPGTVVGTEPAVNEVVDPSTPIVLLVGTSPDRMDDGT